MTESETGATAILKSLAANGVEIIFANSGTDMVAIIEALADPDAAAAMPRTVLTPHEHAAVSMAHGYYLATGRPQAVMLHVNVGLANAVMGLINAHADDIPIIVFSGRTPLTEHDRPGARRSPIQVGQEQFDQAAMVRELVKWDYELRYAENAADLVSRACAIAMSEPHGAVYMAMPSEPLRETAPLSAAAPLQVPARPAEPEPDAIAKAADWLAEASNPLVILQRGDASGRVSDAVSAMAERHALPLVEMFATRNVVASDHPMLVSPDLARRLPEADVVLAVDAGVAWIEGHSRPRADAKVIHLGPDPLFRRMPVRSYATSLAIACNTASGLEALGRELTTRAPETSERRTAVAAEHDSFREHVSKAGAADAEHITKAHVAAAVSRILGDDGIVFNERGAPSAFYELRGPNRFFGNTHAGGLGWCLPAALGAQLADRDRLVVCVIGDGGYMFANPVACHQIAEAEGLPLLTVVVNNGAWDAVRSATVAAFPDGKAARANTMPLTSLAPMPDFCAIAGASRAWTRRVERPGDLDQALADAIKVIATERRQVLLDVVTAPD